MTVLNGIDVSNWQGDSFPWESYRGKIQFAGIRVSEGLRLADEDAARNITGARRIGAVPMGYHFLHAGQDGAQQAEVFLSRAHAAGLKPGDLIAVDAEQGGLDNLTPERLWATAADFAAQLRKHFPGYNPVAYTDRARAAYAPDSAGQCPLWLANPDKVPLTGIGPWSVISFEQTGQRGVDTDVFYGDKAQLARLAFR